MAMHLDADGDVRFTPGRAILPTDEMSDDQRTLDPFQQLR